jgi:lipopolysaccharide transport system ATP-binding protein
MKEPVIKVENLSKAYQIGRDGTGIHFRAVSAFSGLQSQEKGGSVFKIGETNDHSTKGESDINGHARYQF